ncbi:class I SAM-dependent methyltransferase [Cytobacillus sp. FJAT-54145]|uniref:Class I SAM-dependent methyltransferase n=1 Tax=Cytobacillus spartinae TaxID=3299023 RepID=A0ABW6K5G0_9BACI
MDIKKDVQKQFGRSAHSYVTSSIHKDGDDLQKLIHLANTNGTEALLDIATGGGHTANIFAPLVKNVTALDLTQEMLSAAETFIKENGHQNVQFVLGDAEKLPFNKNSFDMVTCRIAPHHFPNIINFIKEVNRVLKPGGQFLLDDNVVPEEDELDKFYNTIEKIRDYSHFRAWKKSEWIQMLETNNFEVREWFQFKKTFTFDSWFDRMNAGADKKEQLCKLILGASNQAKERFNIIISDGKVQSFQGEAIVMKAVKQV